MSWVERLAPARMARVAVVAPSASFRRTLVEVADAGLVELEELEPEFHPAADALARLGSTRSRDGAQLQLDAPDLSQLETQDQLDLILGEAELERRLGASVTRGRVTATLGWMPTSAVSTLGRRLSPLGATALPLRPPPGDPPTQLSQRGLRGAFRPPG